MRKLRSLLLILMGILGVFIIFYHTRSYYSAKKTVLSSPIPASEIVLNKIKALATPIPTSTSHSPFELQALQVSPAKPEKTLDQDIVYPYQKKKLFKNLSTKEKLRFHIVPNQDILNSLESGDIPGAIKDINLTRPPVQTGVEIPF